MTTTQKEHVRQFIELVRLFDELNRKRSALLRSFGGDIIDMESGIYVSYANRMFEVMFEAADVLATQALTDGHRASASTLSAVLRASDAHHTQ
jgi:hypothetical protein